MECAAALPPVMVCSQSLASAISTICASLKVSAVVSGDMTLEAMCASRRMTVRPMRSPPEPEYWRSRKGDKKPLWTMMEPIISANVSKVGLSDPATRVGHPASFQFLTIAHMSRSRSARHAGFASAFLLRGVVNLRFTASVAKKRSHMSARLSTSADVPMLLPVANICILFLAQNISSPPRRRPATSFEVAIMLMVPEESTGISSSM